MHMQSPRDIGFINNTYLQTAFERTPTSIVQVLMSNTIDVKITQLILNPFAEIASRIRTRCFLVEKREYDAQSPFVCLPRYPTSVPHGFGCYACPRVLELQPYEHNEVARTAGSSDVAYRLLDD